MSATLWNTIPKNLVQLQVLAPLSHKLIMKKLENKINRWYGSSKVTRHWLAKHWYRWITFGCSQCYIPCNCSSIYEPKGFAEMAKYGYK